MASSTVLDAIRTHLYRHLFRSIVAEKTSKELQTVLAEMGLYKAKIDGVWGPGTRKASLTAAGIAWRSIVEAEGHVYDPVAEHSTLSRLRTRMPLGTLYHWPGGTETASVLGSVWERNRKRNTDDDPNNDKHTSSNWGCDENRVIWYAAPHYVTYHAGLANSLWVGGDICAPVLPEHKRDAERRGIYVGMVEGYRRAAMDLGPRLAASAASCHEILKKALGEPDLQWTDHATVDPSRKWDCEPWRPKLVVALGTPMWKP